MELTSEEASLMKAFFHFSVKKNGTLPKKNILAHQSRYLFDVPGSYKRMNAAAASLSEKGLLKETDDNDEGLTLTENGETYLYDPFDAESAFNNGFLKILGFFQETIAEGITDANILSVSQKYFSTVERKHIAEIIQYGIAKEFLKESSNLYFLTEEGRKYLNLAK